LFRNRNTTPVRARRPVTMRMSGSRLSRLMALVDGGGVGEGTAVFHAFRKFKILMSKLA
jgi:hypothetical protein